MATTSLLAGRDPAQPAAPEPLLRQDRVTAMRAASIALSEAHLDGTRDAALGSGVLLRLGGLSARLARDEADLEAALELRGRLFRGEANCWSDRDAFDAQCAHVLLERDGRLSGTFRTNVFRGAEIARSYSAQCYGLGPLQAVRQTTLELGRFCLAGDARDADLLRLALGALTVLAEREGARMLFGCASFKGADPGAHRDSLALLARRHLGPKSQRPTRIAAAAVDLSELTEVGDETVDLKAGLRQMPTLLRAYLGLGGWVSDHAVIDRDLQTVHVFTAVDIARIPASRARALRALART
ncbi:MAG: GNAT family N-acyltransferase [Pseudomonadota bacterium]